MRAWNLTREAAHYRHSAFSAGLRAAGFEVRSGTPQGRPGDVLLIWNRYGEYHSIATRFEASGGTVAVCENGYVTAGGQSPHGQKDRQWYAIGLGAHNDHMAIPEGGPERWQALGIDLKPWRADGGHVLVCPNRSFGTPGRIMPPNWANEICAKLRKLTKREVRLRPHPGNDPPKRPLAADLAGAWATVIWQSSAGVHSLIAGIPVFQCSPAWICTAAASLNLGMIEDPAMDDYMRQSAMERMARGQWHLHEIESGEAFRALLTAAPVKA